MDIKDYIPHREPFLLVEDIIELKDKSIRTAKFVSKNENFFIGHYPDYPIMPGVLICEAIMQSGAILIANNIQKGDVRNGVPVVTRMNNIKLKRIVMPGSLLEMDVHLINNESNVFYLKGTATVESKIVTYIEFACGLIKREKKGLK